MKLRWNLIIPFKNKWLYKNDTSQNFTLQHVNFFILWLFNKVQGEEFLCIHCNTYILVNFATVGHTCNEWTWRSMMHINTKLRRMHVKILHWMTHFQLCYVLWFSVQDGRTYVHCNECMRCVKPSWKHCATCKHCCLPSHVCGEFVPSQLCFSCGEPGHKKRDCPSFSCDAAIRIKVSTIFI